MPLNEIDLNKLFTPKFNLFEMEIIGNHLFSAAIPYNSSFELKKDILSVLQAHTLGVTSIDYVRKKYGEDLKLPEPDLEKRNLLKILDKINNEINSVKNIFINEVIRPKHVGLLAAEAALLRLWASFQSVILLISQSYSFEIFPILRMILEQIAWSYTVYEINAEIIYIKPYTTISKLKGLAKIVGRLYGVLSSQAHLDPSIHNQYLKIADNRYYIIYSSSNLISYSLYLCLLTTDIYRIVSEKISIDFITKLMAWRKN
jgi:hypothetical protein